MSIAEGQEVYVSFPYHRPVLFKIFPESTDHPSMGHMVMNFSANLGLDNAATPFGIKAMESLQEING